MSITLKAGMTVACEWCNSIRMARIIQAGEKEVNILWLDVPAGISATYPFRYFLLSLKPTIVCKP